MTTDLYPTIAARIGDPGAYVDRKLTPSGEPMESVPRWAARAVVAAVQPVIDELTAELAEAKNLAAYLKGHRDRIEAKYHELTERVVEREAQLTAANRHVAILTEAIERVDQIVKKYDAINGAYAPLAELRPAINGRAGQVVAR